MTFPNFPLYAQIKKYGYTCLPDGTTQPLGDLKDAQKRDLAQQVRAASPDKHEIVFALIYAFHLDSPPFKQGSALPFEAIAVKNGVKFEVDHLPGPVQNILLFFLNSFK